MKNILNPLYFSITNYSFLNVFLFFYLYFFILKSASYSIPFFFSFYFFFTFWLAITLLLLIYTSFVIRFCKTSKRIDFLIHLLKAINYKFLLLTLHCLSTVRSSSVIISKRFTILFPLQDISFTEKRVVTNYILCNTQYCNNTFFLLSYL